MKTIAVLPGDGIGPEVTAAAVQVLTAACRDSAFEIREHPFAGAAVDTCGDPLPPETLAACKAADAILLGAAGGPQWDDAPADLRPEKGLLRLRRELALFANLRPVRPHPAAAAASPLKPEVLRGVDILFVRELTGGIYFGERQRTPEAASDQCVYSVEEVERVVRVACGLARQRRRRLTSVDKANVLETSRLWRETASRVVADEFPEIALEHVLVDAMAMHLLSRPSDFDVVVTENMFGDILTDEASMLAGSLGMLPSASLGSSSRGLYEPVHGSAPDIAGRGAANPLAAVLSGAMLLRHSLDMVEEAAAIERAVAHTLERGLLPRDLTQDGHGAGTQEVAESVLWSLSS